LALKQRISPTRKRKPVAGVRTRQGEGKAMLISTPAGETGNTNASAGRGLTGSFVKPENGLSGLPDFPLQSPFLPRRPRMNSWLATHWMPF